MLPRIQQEQATEEAEYQQTMQKLGQAEQDRLALNFYGNDDYLGLDDGRPGIGLGTSGLSFGLEGYMAYYLIAGVIAIIIVIIGQTLKHTQYGQQVMNPVPPAASTNGGPVGQSAAGQGP